MAPLTAVLAGSLVFTPEETGSTFRFPLARTTNQLPCRAVRIAKLQGSRACSLSAHGFNHLTLLDQGQTVQDIDIRIEGRGRLDGDRIARFQLQLRAHALAVDLELQHRS